MRYVVVWPQARFNVAGKRVIVTKGNEVPPGVDESILRELVITGAIVAASPPAKAGTDSAGDPAEGDTSTRPTKNAPVAVWRNYAQSVGLTDSDIDGLTKPQVIQKVDEVEAAAEDSDTEDSDGDGDGDDESGIPFESN